MRTNLRKDRLRSTHRSKADVVKIVEQTATSYLQQFDYPDHTEPYTRSAMRMASAGATCFVVATMLA